MADKIRGLTVEISADASQFNKQMNAVRKDAKSTQTELNALTKSLEMNYDPSKFTRAQKLAQDAIDHTAEQADKLRERLKFLEENGDADTTHYRKIQSELAQTELKAQQLEEQLKKINNLKLENVSKSVKDFGDKVEGAGKSLAPLSVAAGATLAGLGAIGTSAVSEADNIATLATQYDMTATALQRFNYIALQTDTDAEVLYKAFVKMRAGAAELATGGTSVASTALAKLGLDLQSFDNSEDQFYGIITALADMEDKTQMVAIANDIFGEKLANNILPLIYSGSGAIKEYAKEFENLGALSDEQVASLAEFDNVMNTINTKLANTKLQLGQALLPVMEKVADVLDESVIPVLQDFSEWFSNLSPDTQSAIIAILGFIAILSPLLIGIGKISTGVSGLITLLGKLKSASLTTSLAVGSLIAAAALVVDLFSNWDSMTNVEKILKMIAAACFVAAAAFAVLHTTWSLGAAAVAITAGIVAAIAGINAAKKSVLPDSEDFDAGSISSDVISGRGTELSTGTTDTPTDPYNVYTEVGTGGTTGDIYNYDNSTTNTTQNVTVVIENYSSEVDVDGLVREINIKLAEAM